MYEKILNYGLQGFYASGVLFHFIFPAHANFISTLFLGLILAHIVILQCKKKMDVLIEQEVQAALEKEQEEIKENNPVQMMIVRVRC